MNFLQETEDYEQHGCSEEESEVPQLLTVGRIMQWMTGQNHTPLLPSEKKRLHHLCEILPWLWCKSYRLLFDYFQCTEPWMNTSLYQRIRMVQEDWWWISQLPENECPLSPAAPKGSSVALSNVSQPIPYNTRICWSHSPSLEVTAPSAPTTTGTTQPLTFRIRSSCSFNPWCFSSFSCSFFLMLASAGIATSITTIHFWVLLPETFT